MAKDNLFAIDFEAAENAVLAANEELVKRHDLLMAAFQRLPTRLESNESIERGKRFAKQLKEATLNCRSNRLSDTKPLRELLRRIESFFKRMEEQTKSAHDAVIAALGEEAVRRGSGVSSGSASDIEKGSRETVLVDMATGEVLGTAPPRMNHLSIVPLEWKVKSVDRDSVDLEAIRPFLTDAALLTAARAHLKASGANMLTGVTYEQRAVLD